MKIKNSMKKLSLAAGLTVALSAVSVPATLFAEEQKTDATIVTQTAETESAEIKPLATSKKKTAKKNGWVKEKGGIRYYKNGKYYTGWHKMGKAEGEKTVHFSYFGSDGLLRTGWQAMGKRTKNPDGNTVKHYSYFGDNGWLRTGWQAMGKGTKNPDGNTAKHYSYFGNDGWLRTGWQAMGKGTKNPDGNSAKHYSYFGDNGWLRTGWQAMGKGTKNPDGNSAKHYSYFGDNGWLRTGLQSMGKGTKNPDGNSAKHLSYFGDNGWLRVGQKFAIGRKNYKADSRGWLKEFRITLKSGIQKLKKMTYGEYKAKYGRKQEYMYGGVVWRDTNPNPLPGLNVTVSFKGISKDEEYILPDNSMIGSISGKMGDFFNGLDGTYKFDEFIRFLTNSGGAAAYSKREYTHGAASYFPSVVFDGNLNGKAEDQIMFYTYDNLDRADNINSKTEITLMSVNRY